mgnify:CR=1 FL=1
MKLELKIQRISQRRKHGNSTYSYMYGSSTRCIRSTRDEYCSAVSVITIISTSATHARFFSKPHALAAHHTG